LCKFLASDKQTVKTKELIVRISGGSYKRGVSQKRQFHPGGRNRRRRRAKRLSEGRSLAWMWGLIFKGGKMRYGEGNMRASSREDRGRAYKRIGGTL